MSQLDALLARSRSPGTFVEKRSFTLAREKAIEKMREFSLRHPRQYVLELVQAAVFAGARWIAVDVSSRAMVVAWVGGRTFTREELGDLFDYLFADQGQPETRHLLQTAVGVNAILQRKPRQVRLESGDGTGSATVRLDLDAQGGAELGTVEDPLAGTYLYADFGGSWFGRWAGTDSFPPEAQLVETRCLYTPVPILLNGSAPFGYRSSREVRLFGVRKHLPVAAPRRGALGIPMGGLGDGIRLVIGGVFVSERPIPALGSGVVGVIADDALRKTADMSDVVEDARWIDMLHDVQPVATRLKREVEGRGYQPPRLPPRVVERAAPGASSEIPLEEVPDTLVQLRPRAAVPRTALDDTPTGEPVFWVEEDVVDDLIDPCDPRLFPYRVLVLTPGQARSLEGRLPAAVTLSRLTNPEDVSFVRNAMDRRIAIHGLHLDTTVAAGGARRPLPVRLHLRLHLEGGAPRWDTEDSGRVPMVVVVGGRTRICTALDLPFQHVSVVAEVGGKAGNLSDAELRALRGPLRAPILESAWRLLPDNTSAGGDLRKRRLELALLADHARPHVIRDADGHLRVTVHLPTPWAPVRERLLRAPLAPLQDGTSLTLERLAGLVGTDGAVTLADPADRELVEPLELRFGPGHVAVVEDGARLLAVVGRLHDSWRSLDLSQAPHAQELLLALPGLVPPPAIEGWTDQEPPAPGVVHWIREDAAPQDLRGGLEALDRALAAGMHADWTPRPGLAGLSPERCDRRARLIRLALADRTDRLGEVRFTDTAGRIHTAAEVVLGDPPPVAVAGGALSQDGSCLPVPPEAVWILDRARRARHRPPLPLLLDDAPELWLDPGSEPEAWLARVPVDWPGLTGWLGLRMPWDPSAGVLLESAESLQVLPGFTRRIPCHGLLRAGRSGPLADGEWELLHLAGLQLYQEVLRRLDAGDLPPEARDAAHRYAAAFCLQTARLDEGRMRPGLARTLASRVEVPDGEGGTWGGLREWIETPAERRPPPPPGAPDRGLHRPLQDPDISDQDRTFDLLLTPVERALDAQCPGVRCSALRGAPDQAVRVLLDPSRHRWDRLALFIREDALGRAAIRGEPYAVGVLSLEIARRALSWARSHGRHLDLLALQQALLAGRLARA